MAEQKIYAAICGVMEDLSAVKKDDLNKVQGFKYRSIDAVMNALKPAMTKNKVFCVPEILEQIREERSSSNNKVLIYSICKIRYRFFTTDGSYVDAITIGEGMDSGDKATNKAMAIAFKYACFQTFCIPTEDLMDDPDRDTPEVKGRKRESNMQKSNKDVNEEKVSSEDIRHLYHELARIGKDENMLLEAYKIERLADMTKKQFASCSVRLKKTPDKVMPDACTG